MGVRLSDLQALRSRADGTACPGRRRIDVVVVVAAATAAIAVVMVANLDRTHLRPDDHVMAEPAVDSCAPVRMATGPAPQEA